MRPQYQRYHEVRAELEKLKAEIILLLGHFPSELEESKPNPSANSSGGWADNSAHTQPPHGRLSRHLKSPYPSRRIRRS
jgi:hypothetical protein